MLMILEHLGAMKHSAGLCVRSPKEKWECAKTILQQLQEDLSAYVGRQSDQGLALPFLESARGFLVHMQQVYPSITRVCI
jgi:hypothetical protein